jgi:hypothetical protein
MNTNGVEKCDLLYRKSAKYRTKSKKKAGSAARFFYNKVLLVKP